jgi:hypothetical protein
MRSEVSKLKTNTCANFLKFKFIYNLILYKKSYIHHFLVLTKAIKILRKKLFSPSHIGIANVTM